MDYKKLFFLVIRVLFLLYSLDRTADEDIPILPGNKIVITTAIES